MCQRTVEICMTAPLSYLSVTSKKFLFEKVSLIDMANLGLLVNTSALDEKYPVLDRENLTIPVQKQLSQKQKIFCHFLAAFL